MKKNPTNNFTLGANPPIAEELILQVNVAVLNAGASRHSKSCMWLCITTVGMGVYLCGWGNPVCLYMCGCTSCGMHAHLFLLDDFQRLCQLIGIWHTSTGKRSRKVPQVMLEERLLGSAVFSFTMYYVVLFPSFTAYILEINSSFFG